MKCNVAAPQGLPGQLSRAGCPGYFQVHVPFRLGDDEQGMAGVGWLDVKSTTQCSSAMGSERLPAVPHLP